MEQYWKLYTESVNLVLAYPPYNTRRAYSCENSSYDNLQDKEREGDRRVFKKDLARGGNWFVFYSN